MARTRIGLLWERLHGERRVALTPTDIAKLKAKADFSVETGAGDEAGFTDEDYRAAGAEIVSGEAVGKADILLSVRAPVDLDRIAPGAMLISLGGRDDWLAAELANRNIVHLGLERLPRISRAQSMDVLSSQASVSGYAAVLLGASALDTLLPMMTTAAGIVKPAKMIALGAGVAGLQALATARRLGAVTFGFDVREAAREQVESLGATFVFPDTALAPSEGQGGYAAEQGASEQERLRNALAPHLQPMQLIVTSAQIPGRRAPVLIDKAAVSTMRPGTVIVDLAAETGGNCTLTKPDEEVLADGVKIYGPTNLASSVATDASKLFGGNVRALLDHLLDADGRLDLGRDDPIMVALVADQVARKELAA